MWDDRNAMKIGKSKGPSDQNRLATWSVVPGPQQAGSKLVGGKHTLKTADREQRKIAAKPVEARRQKSKQRFVWPFP
jgi:hypothetical protein